MKMTKQLRLVVETVRNLAPHDLAQINSGASSVITTGGTERVDTSNAETRLKPAFTTWTTTIR